MMVGAVPEFFQAPPLRGRPSGLSELSGMQPGPQRRAPGSPVKFNPRTNQMFVNGMIFDHDDHQAALASESAWDNPRQDGPEGDGWQNVTRDEFSAYLREIRNPSLGRLAERNFDIGTHNLQMIAGRGLQFAGAEKTGQKMVNAAIEELRKNEPYQRQFTEIDFGSDEGNGAIDWFVANLAQQGPNLIESIAAALAGAVVGGAVGGGANPLSATGGALAAVMGKSVYKQGVLAAAKKYANGEVLSAGEKKLLQEATGIAGAVMEKGKGGIRGEGIDKLRDQLQEQSFAAVAQQGRRQAQAGGAALATAGSSYGFGLGDIYGESIEEGDPSRASAALGALPYAALEALPEFLIVKRLMGGVPVSAMKGGRLRRGAVGAAVGAAAEGVTEAGQESLVLGLTDQDMSGPENVKRLINSFAAGFAIGGPIGGGVNLLRQGRPADLLDSGGKLEPGSTSDPVRESPLVPPGAGPAWVDTITRIRRAEEDLLHTQREMEASAPQEEEMFRQYEAEQAQAQWEAEEQQRWEDLQKAQAEQAEQKAQASAQTEEVEDPLADEFDPEVTVDPSIFGKTEETRTGKDRVQTKQSTFNEWGALREQIEESGQWENFKAFAEQDLPDGYREFSQQAQFEYLIRKAKEWFSMEQNPVDTDAINEAVGDDYVGPGFTVPLTRDQVHVFEDTITGEHFYEDPEGYSVVGPINGGWWYEGHEPESTHEDQEQASADVDGEEPTGSVGATGDIPGGTTGEGTADTGADTQAEPAVSEEAPAQASVQQGGESTEERDQGAFGLKTPVAKFNEAKGVILPPQLDFRRSLSKEVQERIIELAEKKRTIARTGNTFFLTRTQFNNQLLDIYKDAINSDRENEIAKVKDRSIRYTGEDKLGASMWIMENSTSPTLLENAARELVQMAFLASTQDKASKRDSRAYSFIKDKLFSSPLEEHYTPKEYQSLEAWKKRQEEQNERSDIDAWKQHITVNLLINSINTTKQSGLSGTDRENPSNWLVFLDEQEVLNEISVPTNSLPEGYKRDKRTYEYKGGHYITYNVSKPKGEQEGSLPVHLLGDDHEMPTPQGRNSLAGLFVDSRGSGMEPGEVRVGTEAEIAAKQEEDDQNKKRAKKIEKKLARLEQYERDELPDLRRERQTLTQQIRVANARLKKGEEERLGKELKSLNSKIGYRERELNKRYELQQELIRLTGKSEQQRKLEREALQTGQMQDRGEERSAAAGDSPNTSARNTEDSFDIDKLLEEGEAIAAKEEALSREREELAEQVQADLIEQAEKKKRKVLKDMDEKALQFRVTDGSPIEKPLDHIQIRGIVNNLLRRLKKKPKVSIFVDQADMKVRDPQLYQRAAGSNPREFDAAQAAGFSVGDQVILFSKHARTPEYVRFVLAHEVLGHFGLRSILPEATFDAEMEHLYQSDPNLRAAADIRMHVYDMPKAEAVEEVLADYAAALDANILMRVWTRVKNGLNRIGFQFDDDAARYLLSLAKKHLRKGGPVPVNAGMIRTELRRLAVEAEYGRYSLDKSSDDLVSRSLGLHGLNRRVGDHGWIQAMRNLPDKEFKDIAAKSKVHARNLGEWVGSKLEAVQTMNHLAKRSEGLSDVSELIQMQSHMVRQLQSVAASKREFTDRSRIPLGEGLSQKWNTDGPTVEELDQAGEILAYMALNRANAVSDKALANMGDLIKLNQQGEVQWQDDVIEQLKEMGHVSWEQVEQGLSIPQPLGKPTLWKPSFEVTDRLKKIVAEQREVIDFIALQRLASTFQGLFDFRTEALRNFQEFVGKDGDRPTSLHIRDLEMLQARYSSLYTENSETTEEGIDFDRESVKKAEDFLRDVNRSLWMEAKVKDWEDRIDTAAQFAEMEDYDRVVEAMKRLNALHLTEKQAYQITNSLKDLFYTDPQLRSEEMLAKSTLAKAYVPFKRWGKWQLALRARDQNGRGVELSPEVKRVLPYFRVDSTPMAEQMTREINSAFAGTEFTVLNSEMEEVTVTFHAEMSKAPERGHIHTRVTVHEFMEIVTRLGLRVDTEDRARIIKGLTREGSRLRKGLERQGTVGWDPNMIRAVSEHVETSTHVIGKTRYRHRMNSIMTNHRKWVGDYSKLKAKEKAVQNAETEAERFTAQQEYERYVYQYSHSAPKGAREAVVNGRAIPNQGRGDEFRDAARTHVEWYGENDNVEYSTEDALSGKYGSQLKMGVSLMYLGANVSTAILNLFSLLMNAMPHLATYNPKRGYGGGFGIAKSMASITEASRNAAHRRLADATYLKEVAENAELQQKHGITQGEATFLAELTEEGVLQAALFNALIGSAKGGVHNNTKAGAIRVWMSLFTYTEQYTRRTTALASYRLHRERFLAAGHTPEEAAQRATKEAVLTVNEALGEYAMYNRPQIARGNILQYVFVFKMHPVITVQMFASLAWKEKLLFIGLILLLAGLKGLPFAEDAMDIATTLMQQFGIRSGDAEAELTKALDWMLPGATPTIMRGIMDPATGWSLSSRLSFGDMFPLTGVFTAGSDPWREASTFAGPVFSGTAGMLGASWKGAEYLAETVGLKDDTTTLSSIGRNLPISALRGVLDGWAYTTDGRITNARGQVLTEDVATMEIIGRFLGFYPRSAMLQNDVIRMSKEVGAQAKLIHGEFVAAAVKARVAGDRERERQIMEMVRGFNQDHRGTEMELKNFSSKVNTGFRAARQGAVQRYADTAPKNVRAITRQLMDIYAL